VKRRRGRQRRAATASRGAGRPRLVAGPLEIKSAPVGWERPPRRPYSSCPVCWAYLAWVDACPNCNTELMGDRGD
jgi:hypothetical protein